ncbi:hypothetical protein C8J56DRAFT_930867 [Mycena floridula]|nr:hypothetical protein C8J56DRAFT_930867 [Mycena floridula]
MAPPFEPRTEDTQKRVRVLFGGSFVVDTTKAKLVWEFPYYPVYYFPASEIDTKYLDNKTSVNSGATFDLVVGARRAISAVESFTGSDLDGLIKIKFGAADAWFEEQEQIFLHPKDPYKRVDVLQSSRHVRVVVEGVEVANTHQPRLLFETGLPVRTYIPKTDCRLELLAPSELTTACPYKGVANYYHVVLGEKKIFENVVWWYRNANLECATINGFAAFYEEKVDVYVDGELQAKPSRK